MPYAPTPFQLILAQSIASCDLLITLQTNNFLESIYFQTDIKDNLNTGVEEQLKISKIVNPASLQAMLYMLLEIPFENKKSLPPKEQQFLDAEYEKLNKQIYVKIISEIKQKHIALSFKPTTTYKDEKAPLYRSISQLLCDPTGIPCTKIDFITHMRNAIAHSRTEYIETNTKTHNTLFGFHDEIRNKKTNNIICECDFKINSKIYVSILKKLIKINLKYLKKYTKKII